MNSLNNKKAKIKSTQLTEHELHSDVAATVVHVSNVASRLAAG